MAETSATLGELTEVTVYEVQVRATNDEGTSSWSSSGLGSTSSSANATPEFVEGVSAERNVAENTAAGEAIGEPLTATDANADDTLTYALEGTDAASFAIDADSGQLRSLAALDFETNTIYAVTVRADDDQGNSGRIAVTINITDQTEPPAEPAVLTVTATSGTTDSLTVTWTAPDNTGPPITGYDLQYVESVGGEFSDGPQNVAETSAVITGLMENTPYVVQVRARNADGVSGWSRLSGVGRTGAPEAEPPAAPAAPTVTTTSGTTDSLTVTWTAPDNTGPPITGYDLQYVEPVGGEFSDGPQNVAETSAVITGLMENTPYVVQVRARNADGVSGWSRLSGVGRTGAPDGGDMATVTVAAARSTAIAGLDLVQLDPDADGGDDGSAWRDG